MATVGDKELKNFHWKTNIQYVALC